MKRSSAIAVHRRLAAAYGPLPRITPRAPLAGLVQTILSQNTSDVNSGRAFRGLCRAFPNWDAVAAAPALQIERAIREGGLARTKSRVIKKVLAEIDRREGSLTLARLRRMTDAQAIDYLTSLPGVGMKTANCVLLFSLGRPVFPVDTHVFRTTQRLGWLPGRIPPDRATALLEPHIPPDLRLGLHLYLVAHGRRICRAQAPHCPDCPVRDLCKAFRSGLFRANAPKKSTRR